MTIPGTRQKSTGCRPLLTEANLEVVNALILMQRRRGVFIDVGNGVRPQLIGQAFICIREAERILAVTEQRNRPVTDSAYLKRPLLRRVSLPSAASCRRLCGFAVTESRSVIQTQLQEFVLRL